MPDIASVLKEEITRLARKEVKSATGTQSKQIQSLKTNLRDLKSQIAALQKSLSRSNSTPAAAPDEQEEGAAGQAIQCMNLMLNLPETLGLTGPGLFP